MSDDGANDWKATQSMDITIQPEQTDAFRFVVSGDLHEDLDGESEVNNARSGSIYDKIDSDFNGYLYEFYGEYKPSGSIKTIRMGRQYVNNAFSAHIDGASSLVSFISPDNTAFIYGGLPGDLYGEYEKESKIAGAGLNLRLPFKIKLAFEYQGADEGYDDDELYERGAVTLNHALNIFKSSLRLTSNNSELNSIKLSGHLIPESESDLDFNFTYFRQVAEIEYLPLFIAPFTRISGSIKPYHQASLSIGKDVDGGDFYISCGGEYRQLSDEIDASNFNHSFYHFYITNTVNSLFNSNTRLTLQADIWQQLDISEDKNMIFTGGGEIESKLTRSFRVRVGSFYSLYKYNYYMDKNEKTDVYTIHSDVLFNFNSGVYIKGRYQLDIYDIYEHQISLTTGLRF